MILFITWAGSFIAVSEFKMCLHGLTPAEDQAPHSCSLTPPRWDGTENHKGVELMGWGKDGLMSKGKAAHLSKAKQGIHSWLHHVAVTW